MTIYGAASSYAETYAKVFGITFSSGQPEIPPSGQKTISENQVTISPVSYIYDGKAKTPAVTVKDGDTVLKSDTDYTVSYADNVKMRSRRIQK